LDSLSYLPTWHNRNFVVTKGKSLERINPSINSNDKSNWSSCVANEGATPGKSNSIFTENLEAKSKVAINPNPFSPDGDGFEDFTIINFDLPYKISQVNIKVFDNQGRLVRSILSNRPSSSNNSIIFDGLDDNGKALRMGIYILLIEVAAEGSNNIETIKTPIVIARKL
jgi:flagellar hook assembly protein FlgD